MNSPQHSGTDWKSTWNTLQSTALEFTLQHVKTDDHGWTTAVVFRGEKDHDPCRSLKSKLQRHLESSGHDPFENIRDDLALHDLQKRDLWELCHHLPDVDPYRLMNPPSRLDTNNHQIRVLIMRLQHYGRQTVLLDATWDLNVAIFFACQDPDQDGCVKAIPCSKHSIWQPEVFDARIHAQKGVHLWLGPNPFKGPQDGCWHIPAQHKRDLLQHLERTYGINSYTLFPDLPGAVAQLNARDPFQEQPKPV